MRVAHARVAHAPDACPRRQLAPSSMAVTAAAADALKDEELAALDQLLRRLALLDDAPPHDAVVRRVGHAHYPLAEGAGHRHRVVLRPERRVQPGSMRSRDFAKGQPVTS